MKPAELQIFLVYTRRFHDILGELPLLLTANVASYDVSSFNKKNAASTKAQVALVRFFNLCSEEYFLHDEGLIQEKVWTLWTGHTKSLMSTPLARDAWSRNKRHFDAEFVAHFDRLL